VRRGRRRGLAAKTRVVRAENRARVFWIELFGLCREADEVAEAHGDDLALLARDCLGASDAPHIPRRQKPSGFAWPQLGQLITRREYGVSAE